MTTPKCPLCGKPLKLSTIENKGQLNFFACYKCNYQLRMSPRKDFALEDALRFLLGYLQDPQEAKKYAEAFGLGKAADAVGTNPGGNIHNSLMSGPIHVGGAAADGKEGK